AAMPAFVAGQFEERKRKAGAGPTRQPCLRRSQAAGLVHEVAEGALQFQGFGGEGGGRLNAAGVFVSKRVKSGGSQFADLWDGCHADGPRQLTLPRPIRV